MRAVRNAGAARSRRSGRHILFLLFPVLVAVAALLAFPGTCLAADIRPPTDAQVNDALQHSTLLNTGWSLDRQIKLHRVEEKYGKTEVRYYLYVTYTAELPDKDDPEKTLSHAAFDTAVWKGVEGGPAELEHGLVGGQFKASESMGEARAMLDAMVQESIQRSGRKPGWPVVSPEGKTVTGGTTEQPAKEGGGSKIPGPGSWWEWLAGTVVAGGIASVISIISSFLGSAPTAPPPQDLITFEPPPPSDVAGGTVGLERPPHEPLEEISDSTALQTVKNILDDIGDGTKYVSDKTKWVFDGVTNPDNWKDALDKAKDLHGKYTVLQNEFVKKGAEHIGKDIPEYLEKVAHDPSKPFKDLDKMKNDLAKAATEGILVPILKDPWGTMKTVLALDFLEKAMDYRIPLPERIANYGVFALNTVGLIDGVSGLKSWLSGGGSKAVGLIDDAARGTGLLDDAARGGKVLESPPKRIPVVKEKPGFFDKLTKADRSKLKAAWKKDLQRAESNVKSLRDALKTGDAQARVDAVLKVQGDPLSIQALNNKDKSLIKGFKTELGKLQNSAMDDTLQKIAKDRGVDKSQLEVFKGTNPKQPGVKIKAPNDQDYTVRIKGEEGALKDYSAAKAQKHYDESFYKAAGSPEGTNPAKLGKDCRNIAVDQHSSESLTMTKDDFDKMTSGKVTSHTDTVARGMQFKSDECFMKADSLAKAGELKMAQTERFLGQRETVKSFKNQVRTRFEYISRDADPAKIAEMKQRISAVEDTVNRMDRMVQDGVRPDKIDDFLRSRNTTAEGLSKEIADIYRKLTP